MVPSVLLLVSLLSGPADLRFVGSARATGDSAFRLTPSKPMQRGAAWRIDKVPVRDGFETSFRFRISDLQGLGPGADGFAFVIQNNGPTALAGKGASGGFGLGYSPGDRNKAIANSLAIFFDTFQNHEDASGNAVSLCTNGGNRKEMRWPPPRLAINWNPSIDLKDGNAHEVRIEFVPPLITVTLDGQTALRAPVDLARMVAADGTAFIGFTASTGEGYENHDIVDWRFDSRAPVSVSSSISFASIPQVDCLPNKSLCTPAAATVEPIAPGRFRVLLPAHLNAEIPNPTALKVEILQPRGTACWSPSQCASLAESPGSLRHRTEAGRTRFSLNDTDPTDNQGYFEFEVLLRP